MTRLVAELRASGHDNHRPVHLLNVTGFRAEESPARRRRVPYAANPAASNGRRRVDDWYPIQDWTLAQVWERIPTARTRSHQAYAAGMSRLSCRFCVLSFTCRPRVLSAPNPDPADRYAEVERRIGHRFRVDLTMADAIAEAHDAVATHWRPHLHPTRGPGGPRAAPPTAPAALLDPAHESSADRLRAEPAPCAACCRTAYQPPRGHIASQNQSL